MISVTDLKKVYRQGDREVRALDGVSLEVPRDHVHAVIGQSGAGKSTLVRCLAMLDRPTSGTVEIGGLELTAVHSGELRRYRRRLGVVFQHANLFDSRTVAANVAYPLELAGLARAERLTKAAELLSLVGLGDRLDAYPAQLSGGQRQRVGIARALATDPDVLLCDEPTSALDPATTGEILDLIAGLRARLGLAVLVITHEMQVVKRVADSVSLLQAGKIVETGPIGEVLRRPHGQLSEALLGLPPVTAERTVEVLDVVRGDQVPALAQAGRELGVDLPVLAAIVEPLGDETFHRSRIRVPDSLEPAAVVAELTRHGAQAWEESR
ncbi:MAG: ATP-binding cassette domain-containing protein [Actinomycetia bacterium]|nr:ATP-binding cassette domain-containing protein [Actinomycetes bacterium]